MKDAKLVLFIALPMLAIVAGVFVYNMGEVSAPGRVEEDDPPPPEKEWIEAARSKPVPPEPEIAPHPRGALPLPPPLHEARIKDEIPLDPATLKKLLAEEGNLKWAVIEAYLSRGTLDKPDELASLLIGVMRKEPGEGSWVAKYLPMLVARNEQVKAQVVDELLAYAGETQDVHGWNAAFNAVGQIGDVTAVPHLADYARNMTDQNGAKAAIFAIGMIGGRDPAGAAPELGRLLSEFVGSNLEGQVIQSMALVASPVMVDNLSSLVGEKSPLPLRLAAATALGRMRTPSAVGPLKDLLRGEVDPRLAGAVIHSLGTLGTTEAVEELLRIRSEGGERARAAGNAVGLARNPGAVGPILREIDSVRDENMKLQWVQALGRSESAEPIEKLRSIASSQHETDSVRGSAMEALARLNDGESASSIIDVLDASSPDALYLRRSALISLQSMARIPSTRDVLLTKAVPVLRKIVAEDSKDYAYYRAQRILTMLGK